MALIEYDVYKQKLRDLEPELKKLGDALDIDAVAQEAARLEDETTQDGFWNNLERSQKVQTRLKQLQNKLHRFKKLMSTWEDLTTLCEMGQEAEDEEILEELKTEFPALETEIEEIRMTTLLSGEYDANNVILQLHSGAGGTEAQDWCQMLYRMYTRWAERHGYAWKTLDYEECDEAGIKSAVISIEGENAYGLLKSEHGVHRLVRVSPFDANARRQTSFASLEVMPELDNTIQVNIRPEDIDIVPVEQGQLIGTVTNVTFKGMQYDIIVDFRGFKWLIQTTDHSPVGARIGVKIDPEGFHIMKKSEYSGMFGDYSSYSEEYEELADASVELEEEESEDED